MVSILLPILPSQKVSKIFYFFTNDANYAQHHGGITLDNGATLVVEVMEMVYFTHDPEILRLTDQHGIKATEIVVSKTEDTLDQSHEVAVNEQSRDAVVRYWSVFMRDYTSGAIDYDVDGLFRWQFDITYEE